MLPPPSQIITKARSLHLFQEDELQVNREPSSCPCLAGLGELTESHFHFGGNGIWVVEGRVRK